jgi:hypothetical protein
MPDFLPSGDPEFNIWFTNFVQYIALKTSGSTPQWKHIPKNRIAELNAAYERWSAAYALCFKPHTDVETRAKNEARTDAEKVIRPFKRQFIDFAPEVTDAERIAMRCPVRKKRASKGFVPGSLVEIIVDTSIIRQLSFHFKELGSESRGKPDGVQGMEFRYAILDAPPASIKDLINPDFSTSSPITVYFEENQRGKRVYYSGRWESRAGKKGPWSEIGSAIIP